MREYEENNMTLSDFENLKVGQIITYTGKTKTFPCGYKIVSNDILKVIQNKEYKGDSPPGTREINCIRLKKQLSYPPEVLLYSDWIDPKHFEFY